MNPKPNTKVNLKKNVNLKGMCPVCITVENKTISNFITIFFMHIDEVVCKLCVSK